MRPLRLHRIAGALDGGKSAAAGEGVERLCSCDGGQHRPHHARGLRAAVARDALHQLAAIQHAHPLDSRELGDTFDEARDLDAVSPIWGPHLRRHRRRGPVPGRFDGPDRAADGIHDPFGSRRRVFLRQRCERDRRFEGSPQLGDLMLREVRHAPEHPAAVDGSPDRRPARVTGEVRGDHRHGGHRRGFLAFDLLVPGHRLEQRPGGGGFDVQAVREAFALGGGKAFERREKSNRHRIKYVRSGGRDQLGERRVVGGELQRRQVMPRDQCRHRLPGGHLLLLAPFCQHIEEHLAGLGHRLGQAPVAAANRSLDRAGRLLLLPGTLFGDRSDQPPYGQHMLPLRGRELGDRVDESLDLTRIRPEAPWLVVVGSLNPAEQAVTLPHGSNFGGAAAL